MGGPKYKNLEYKMMYARENQGFAAITQDFIDTTSWTYGNILFVKK